MNKENDNTLCSKYPNLYRDRNKSPYKTCMCWGFTCGDGWYDIIDELSAKLETEIVRMKENGVPEEELPVAVQVKEKFGIARIYVDNATEEMYDLIHEAENKTASVCEECGKEGKLRGRYWLKTLCDECSKEI